MAYALSPIRKDHALLDVVYDEANLEKLIK